MLSGNGMGRQGWSGSLGGKVVTGLVMNEVEMTDKKAWVAYEL
jgi:hypothetical protein